MDESQQNRALSLARANTVYDLAQQARTAGEYGQAHGFFKTALKRYDQAGDARGRARCLLGMSALSGWITPESDEPCYFGQPDPRVSEALDIFRRLNDAEGVASALRQVATHQPPDQALATLEKAIALSQSVGDRRGEAAGWERLGSHLALTDQNDARSLAGKEKALALFRELGDKPGMAQTLFSLSVSLMRGDPIRRLAVLEETLALFRETGDRQGASQVLGMLEMHPALADDLDRREAYLREAIALDRARGSRISEAQHLRRLADIARRRGDGAEAVHLRALANALSAEPKIDPAFIEAVESRDPARIADLFRQAAADRNDDKEDETPES